MKVYHLTGQENARLILAHGFRDGTGTYLTNQQHQGVWFSDKPLLVECHIPFEETACFEVDLPDQALSSYEWCEEGKPYREWFVPAAVANAGSRRVLSAQELLVLSDQSIDRTSEGHR